jgi:transposase InsO family protein
LIKVSDTLKEEGCLHQYILTIIDHHSKKAWAKCLKNKRADSVAAIIGKLFDKVYNQRGTYPRILHTDNGGEFRNAIMEAMCKEKGIKQISGAPYHSQSQGLVERLNRTVQESIAIYKQELAGRAIVNPETTEPYNLKAALRAILKVYNQKQHSTIRMTPCEAYLQMYISTRQIKDFTAEEIRAYVVKQTTSKVDYFQRLGTPV